MCDGAQQGSRCNVWRSTARLEVQCVVVHSKARGAMCGGAQQGSRCNVWWSTARLEVRCVAVHSKAR
eukprot:357700-Chlamydomonas_euryale.AAC.7